MSEIKYHNNIKLYTLPLPHPPNFQNLHKTFLYQKYSSSQNYYYTKDINNIIAGNLHKKVILFNDYQILDDPENLLKRLYKKKDYKNKIQLLTEYYKYHEDVPRIFMKSVCKIIHNFFDKKRRINYIKIKKMLNLGDDSEVVRLHDSDTSLSVKESIYGSLLNLLSDSLKRSLYAKKGKKKGSDEKRKKFEFQSDLTILDLDSFLGEVFEGKDMGKRKFDFEEFGEFSEESRFVTENLESEVVMNFTKKFRDLKGIKQPKLFDKKKMCKNKNLKKIVFKNLKKDSILQKMTRKKNKIKKFFKKKEEFKETLKKKNSLKKKKIDFALKKKNSKSKSISKKYQNLNINNLNININFNPNSSGTSLNPFKKKKSMLYYSKENKKKKMESPILLKKQHLNFSKSKFLKSQKFLKNPSIYNFLNDLEINPYARTLEKMDFKKKNSSEPKIFCKKQILADRKKKLKFKKNKKNFDNLENLKNYNNKKKKIRQNSLKSSIKNLVNKKLSEKIHLSSIKSKLEKRSFRKKNCLKSFKSNRFKKEKKGLKIFLSHDKNKKIISNSKKKTKKSLSKKSQNKKKKILYNFLDETNLKNYNKKFSTFGNSLKFGIENKTLNDNKYNTINYLELFKNDKKFIKENKIKKNIKKLLKGFLKRKIFT